ncbi:histidine kinase [Longispora urticae]
MTGSAEVTGSRWRVTRGEIGVAVLAAVAAPAVWLTTGRGEFWPRWVWFGLAAALAGRAALHSAWRTPPGPRRWLAVHTAVFGVLVPAEFVIWGLSGGGFLWPVWALVVLGGAFTAHAWAVSRLPPDREVELTRRVDTLVRTRRVVVDGRNAELKRIERDLHDGAQARLVSLGVSLGLAEHLVRTDPEAAIRMLGESRASVGATLEDLRTVMRQIRPPVLADRGLVGAVEALALDLAVPVTVGARLPGAVPESLEPAVYFAVAECLANVVKHSGARSARVDLAHADGRLTVTVTDDGRGGTAADRGSGLRGVADRLEVFDGRVRVDSPACAGTRVTIDVPCGLESR